ncbi:hypothetical protein [Allorhizocola rhizosphaerae]|uniref:hypothetical protein n=1 Tax=Allorhizocola rhizosphaerae TaxID=1872709 RepID=UPI000E3C6E1D|nr:hypothetical protein [Allorhizocola rhizosphaerae]
MTDSPAERYLRLGLRLARHDDGVVDAYFGPAELAAQVGAEAPVEPRALVKEADALLGELADGWLRDQVAALRVFAGGLAGESRSYADEVEGCYGIRPVHTDEAVFAEAHERLADLLPGDGPLTQRFLRWRESMFVPADKVEPVVAAVIEEARTQTRALVDLPEGEGVDLEFVRDVTWLGYNDYLGDLRGRVSFNVTKPMTAMDLLLVAIHETYPGHQAERSCHEFFLVRGQGLLEETLALTPAPQSVISEGIGELAPQILLTGEGGPRLAAILHDAGVEFDLAHALAVERAARPCQWAQVNAALLLHEHGAGQADARSYLERWALIGPDMAAHVVRFITEPSSRTYVMNYPAGYRLCQSYVDGDPHRFRRLLTEQMRVTDLTTSSR